MKKILLLSILIFNLGNAQKNSGDSAEPVPSASSMTSYINAPISLSTGVPDISIPLFNLSTTNNKMEIPVELSYHVYNTGINKVASDVGLGWLLTRGGTISRTINNEVDEIYDDATRASYIKNSFDDIYYYNIPGSSGKFKFVRNTSNNTFSVSNISGTNVKIEYTREANTATLVLSSFTIKDDKGFKYIFNDYSKSLFRTNFYYKSAFFLTRVLDESDIEVASFTYDKNSKYKNGTSVLLYQNCKVNEISTAFGKIKFGNLYDSFSEQKGINDPYIIDNVSLFDPANRLISKYRFSYLAFSSTIDNLNQDKRILSRLEKLDKNSIVIESRDFSYDQEGSNTGNYTPISNYLGFECNGLSFNKSPRTYTLGTLKKVSLPGGGYTMYNFEANEHYEDRSNIQIDNKVFSYPDLQYISPNEIKFDTNQTKLYTIQASSGTVMIIDKLADQIYDNQYSVHQPEHVINFRVKNGNTVLTANSCGQYILNPGTYTVEIIGFGNGTVYYSMIKSLPTPYRNASPIEAGVRIANIQHFDFNDILQKTTAYQYTSFTSPNNSSGGEYLSENCGGNDDSQINSDIVLYKNVKEIYGDTTNNIGYTQYYFKMPEEFVSPINGFKPYYNITSSGLQNKQEIFDRQNVMTGFKETEYVMEDINGAPEYNTCTGYTTKAAWIKSARTTSKTFFDNATSLVSISEISYSPYNFAVSKVKETSPEGIITEKNIKYPSDLSNTKLMTANILDVPLETETKVNGVLTEKAETKYENTSHLYPTSLAIYDLSSQTAITKAVISSYDNKGNVREIISPNGIPTATIYGYNQTQPIAKVVGATYDQIASLSVVTAAVTASNNDATDPANEPTLLTALENLRKNTAMKEYSVTTYTYDPLIGITSTTSPNGQREIYKYDTAGRLLRTEDSDGKLLRENGYNYKH